MVKRVVKSKAKAVAAPTAPTRVQPARTVKTKEYRDAHHTSWSVHSRHMPKDPNRYYALTLSSLVQFRSDKVNATIPRVLESVKSKVAPGAFSVKSKVNNVLVRMLETGRINISSRGVVSLTSKRTVKRAAPKRSVEKKKTTKKATRKTTKKATTKATTKTRGKKAKAASKKVVEKPAPKKRGRSAVEVEEAPAAKKSKRCAQKKKADEKYRWEYKERDNWFPYSEEGSNIVEAAYQDYLKDPNQIDVRSVKSGMWCYQVDFTNMTQTNIQHEAHTVRDIRRALVPSE